MPTFTSIHFPPPQDPSEFEDLCRDLWARIWEDPNAQRNGRSGQGQKGVDVFGSPQRGRTIEGVQCKVRSSWLGQYLTEQDVGEAIEKAEAFEPKLARLTIATTSPRDAGLQEEVRLLSDLRLCEGKFPVTVAFWEEIQSRLTEHDDLLRKYYSPFLSFERRAGQPAVTTNDLQVYLDRFRQHVSTGLPPLVPTCLVLSNSQVHPMELKGEVARHGAVHLYGPSGSGKSHLARHLALELIAAQYASILVPAKYYRGDFHALLDRSVEHLTTAPADSLLLGSGRAGFTPLLILDGFNECPESLRADLAREIKALQLRMTIHVIVTSRPEVPCDSMLPGRLYKLDYLSHDERRRLIAYYGDSIEGIVDILRTPLDVRIAAESAVRIEASSPTQYDLFHAYARDRLRAEPTLGFAFLVRCASKMADILALALSESEFHRLAQVAAGASAGRALEAVNESGLMSFSHGYCSFWHERIQRFFQAEALLIQHTDVTELAAKLRSPRNEDTQGLVLGALKDASAIQLCIPVIQSEELLVSMLSGDAGTLVAAAIKTFIRQLLGKAGQELSSLVVTRSEEDEGPLLKALSITSSVLWEAHENRLISFAGEAFVEGHFCDEIWSLVQRFDHICSEKAAEIFSKNPWGHLFPSLYVGIGPQTLPASRIVQAIPLRIHREWSVVARQFMSLQLEDLDHQSPGNLLLLSAYVRESLWGAAETPLLAQLPTFIRHLWSTGIYHLRLEVAELGQAAAHRVEEPLRTAIEELLNSFIGDNFMLNSSIFEALAQYRDLGVASEEKARSEVRRVLDRPRRKNRDFRKAAGIFGNQFEDVLGAHYLVAVEELQGKDRTDFHIMAALGMEPYDFFLDLVLKRLMEFGAPEARAAFVKWAAPPVPEGLISHMPAGVFLLAHIGLARFAESPPVGALTLGRDGKSWRVWGEILFWIHKVGPREVSVREACASCWRKLHGPLLLASIDPIFEMERYARVHCFREDIYKPVEFVFPVELRKLYEEALPRSSDLTSVFGYPSHWRVDREVFMIEGLGRFGDEESILLLQQYAESDQVGRSAIKAVRSIRERMMLGADSR